MLDIKFIRENKDVVKEGARKKNISVDIDRLISLDEERVKLGASVDELRRVHNKSSKDFAEKKGDVDALKGSKQELRDAEKKLQEVMEEWRALMLSVPNVPDVSVAEGDDDTKNVEVRTWGEKPAFDFAPKNHIELLRGVGGVDFEAGVKVSGFRGYFLKNSGALLSFALWKYAIDFFTKKGFEFIMTPALLKKEGFLGTGYIPQGEEDLYKTQDETYLSGTAEVPVMASFMDMMLSEDVLPKKILAYSPCFRREAGSYGKDTKGLVRVHEFFKLEQVVLCEAKHETSVALHEEITKNAEELMQSLEIPYRVVINCGGDLGLGQVKKYDIESWVPSENKYRETHSSSYFHDFQARRLNIKYKDKSGKKYFVHSLNNTALATPRALVSLIENNQDKDGNIRVPKNLAPYMGTETIKT